MNKANTNCKKISSSIDNHSMGSTTNPGPRGMDKLIHDDKGTSTICNDGATIMKLLNIVHIVANIIKSQNVKVYSFVGSSLSCALLFMFPFYNPFMHQLLNVARSGLLESLQSMDVVYYFSKTLNFKLKMGP